MNTYISHSRAFDFENELYLPLRSSELFLHHTFVLPHDKNTASFDVKNLFRAKECDLVLAEVSVSTIDQGIELGWADSFGIPIVCIYKQGSSPATTLHTISSRFIMYTSPENMIDDIGGILKKYE